MNSAIMLLGETITLPTVIQTERLAQEKHIPRPDEEIGGTE